MGRYVFRLPDIGEGIAEAEIVAWHVKVGDRIEEDGPLADMMTDKATVAMESPVAGVVREVAGEIGDTVAIGAPLAVIETDGEEAGPEERSGADQPAASVVEQVPSPQPSYSTRQGGSARPARASASKVLASPAVRARARQLGIDLATVPSGPEGIVRHQELDALLVARTSPAKAQQPSGHEASAEPIDGAGERIKVVGLRRRIAENMAASKRHIPHFSYVEECDVTALEQMRAELNAGREPRLTLLPFLIAAICRSVPEYPMINARYDDEAGVVTRYASVHLGIATQTPAGLMVPVIRDAQQLGLAQLAAEIARLAAAARDGTAKPEELSGSTLTVTSLGPLGGIATTPIVNRPEVAIIGPNRIVERPVYVDGDRLEKRKLMNLSISCDHRVVDGWDAASFVQAVKQRLEAPLLLVA